MIRIGQANERNVFVLPILLKDRDLAGTHSQNLYPSPGELFIFIPQARQLRAAIWSHEPTQERKEDRFTAKIRKMDEVSLHILKLKLRREFPRSDQRCHWLISFRNLTVASTACCCWSARVMVARWSPGCMP